MKNVKILSSLYIVLLLSLLSACSSKPTAKVDFNPEINFTAFTHFQFSPAQKETLGINPIMITRMQTTVQRALSNQGLTQVSFVNKDSDSITIKVTYSQQEKENNSTLSIGLGTGRMGSNGGGSIGMSTNVPLNRKSNTVTKIMIDMSHNGVPIWYGTDSYESRGSATTDETNNAIHLTINRILEHFPPSTDNKSRVTSGFESLIL